MRRGAWIAAILATAVGLVTVQASCAARDEAGSRDGTGTKAEIPERYSSWRLAFSTGRGDVYSLALNGSEPNRLFSTTGLDSSTLLQPVKQTSDLLFERLIDGRLDLMSFSFETGKSRRLAGDISEFVSVEGDSAFYIAAGADNKGALCKRDLSADESRVIAESALAAGSAETSGPAVFSVARSDPANDPIDQDLFTIEDERPEKLSSADHEYTFGSAYAVPEGVLYTVVRQGGEVHGKVRLWSRRTRETTEIHAAAALMDVAEDGRALLLTTADREKSGADGGRLVLVGSDGRTLRTVDRVFDHYPLARVAGDDILVAFTEGGRHRMSIFDTSTGSETRLHDDPRVRVSEIEPLDGDAALCVLDTLGVGGLPRLSELAFVPLTSDASRAIIARETSGFIHMSAPLLCPD